MCAFAGVLGVLAFVGVFVTVCSMRFSPLAVGSFLSLFPPSVLRVSRASLSLSDPSVPDGRAR